MYNELLNVRDAQYTSTLSAIAKDSNPKEA